MLNYCIVRTCDEKENIGAIDRQPKVCAAGKPTTRGSKESVKSLLQIDCWEDEVDALVHDAIIPPVKPTTGRRRGSPPKDTRYAGIYSGGWDLINPPTKTNFMEIVNDFKETTYASYWKRPLGSSRDFTPLLPEGYGSKNIRFGKTTKSEESLYDLIFPIDPCSDQELHSHMPGIQCKRNYCQPAFDENKTFGHKYQRSSSVECCLKDENIYLGKNLSSRIGVRQAEYQRATTPKLGLSLTPNDNINTVPKDFRFGLQTTKIETTATCLNFCKINPEKALIQDCFKHLNKVRKYLRRKHPHTIFRTYYLKMKFVDKCKTGWLPKEEIYDFCKRNRIYFAPNFMEPLLSAWNAFDGSHIEYETFVRVINYKEPFPDLPKLQDIEKSCLDFRTTYGEMVKPGQEHDNRFRAGLPTARHLDLDYPKILYTSSNANNIVVPKHSHAFSQIIPSTLTNSEVTYRDMYTGRDKKTVKRVFEASGEKFTDENFEKVWTEAVKYHSKGMVCNETFRKALSVI